MTNFKFDLNRKSVPTRNSLKLGGESMDVDSFVDQWMSEGEKVTNLTASTSHTTEAPLVRAKANVHTEA